MFDYLKSIRGWGHECTPPLFSKIIDSTEVTNICAEIEDAREKMLRGEMSREDYKTFKDDKKKELPGFTFQAHYINGGRRVSENAVRSGFCIYDKDNTPNPKGWLCQQLGIEDGDLQSYKAREVMQRWGIVLAHISPSLEGVRLVFRIAKEVSFEDAQYSLSKGLSDDDYDGSVKDIARLSFAVPRDYILYMDGAALFTPTPDEYVMPFEIFSASQVKREKKRGEHKDKRKDKVSIKVKSATPIVAKSWRCKKPTKRVMMIIEKAMQKRGISRQSLEHKGQRHFMFVNLLSTGICRLLTKEELMGGLKKLAPKYAKEDDCWQLVADWYGNYLNENKPVSQDFAWTFAEVLNIDDEGNSLDTKSTEDSTGVDEESYEESADEDQSNDVSQDNSAAQMRNDFNMQISELPIGLSDSLIGIPDNLIMPVLCSIMPLGGSYADQVVVRYADGKKQHLGLMSIIVGEQASKKSICKDVTDLWKRAMHEDDIAQRKLEDDWKQRRKNKKANEKGEPDPQVLIREIPVTTSCSTLLKRFKNSRDHCLYSFGEELDTLRKTNGAGSWSSKYDIYRLSFDRGEWGQDYNSDQAESGIVKVAYNWTILGTYGALKKCFKSDNIENGLSSRVMIAEMPDNRFARMTTFHDVKPINDENIQKAAEILRSSSGYVDTPKLREAMAGWVEEKRIEALKAIDDVKDTYRKRAAVIGFRCGVIFYLLEMNQVNEIHQKVGGVEEVNEPSEKEEVKAKDPSSSSKQSSKSEPSSKSTSELFSESDACIHFAKMMADYVMKEQCKLFGEGLKDERVAKDELDKDNNANVFEQLPHQFTMDELRAIKGHTYTDNTLRVTVHRWRKDGWIAKVHRGVWEKVI